MNGYREIRYKEKNLDYQNKNIFLKNINIEKNQCGVDSLTLGIGHGLIKCQGIRGGDRLSSFIKEKTNNRPVATSNHRATRTACIWPNKVSKPIFILLTGFLTCTFFPLIQLAPESIKHKRF